MNWNFDAGCFKHCSCGSNIKGFMINIFNVLMHTTQLDIVIDKSKIEACITDKDCFEFGMLFIEKIDDSGFDIFLNLFHPEYLNPFPQSNKLGYIENHILSGILNKKNIKLKIITLEEKEMYKDSLWGVKEAMILFMTPLDNCNINNNDFMPIEKYDMLLGKAILF